MTKTIKTLSESKGTTIAGGIASIGAVIVSLVPSGVWASCTGALNETGSPIMTASLLIAGVGLTIIGPSLAKSRR